VGDALAHPLTILVFGALLTGLLVPAITRRWQDRQKELELKTELVSALSEVITSIVLAVQFVRLGRARTPTELMTADVLADRQRAFDEAYRTWEVQSAVLGTKLQAYFSATRIPKGWTTFSEVVTDFYALEGQDTETEARSIADLQEGLAKLTSEFAAAPGVDAGEVTIGILQVKAVPGADWGAVRNGILQMKAALIQRVLNSPASPFRSRLSLETLPLFAPTRRIE
jgi:hypothetical protein